MIGVILESSKYLLALLTAAGVGISGGAVLLLAVLLANVSMASRDRIHLRRIVLWGQAALLGSIISLLPLIVSLRTLTADVSLVLFSVIIGVVLFGLGMLSLRHREIH